MESTIGIYRARAEAGTSFGVAYHQFYAGSYSVDEPAGSYSVDERVCRYGSARPGEACWEEDAPHTGIQYKVQTFGGVTFIAIVLRQPAPALKQLDPYRKALTAWKRPCSRDLVHTSVSSPPLHGWRTPAVSERPETLASALVKTRNRIVHGLQPVGFGKMENSVESTIFLSVLSRLERARKVRAAARYVYSHFYELRMAEEYALCDRILGDVDTDRLTPVVLIALLTITAPIKKWLDSRAGFYDKARRAIERQRGPEATKQLLAGLE